MNEAHEHDMARYWSGLAILERLSETGAGLASEEVAAILGARSVKGIGSALSGTRSSLGEVGIRLDEAVHRRAGARIHALDRRTSGSAGTTCTRTRASKVDEERAAELGACRGGATRAPGAGSRAPRAQVEGGGVPDRRRDGGA